MKEVALEKGEDGLKTKGEVEEGKGRKGGLLRAWGCFVPRAVTRHERRTSLFSCDCAVLVILWNV